jgi:hypothetical protein
MPKDNTKEPTGGIHEEALKAFQEAIDEVIFEHQRLNLPLWIKRNGKLEAVSAEEILKEKKGMNS